MTIDNVPIREVLIISTMPGAENCARLISQHTDAIVEVSATRRDALTALRRTAFDVVVIEESLAETDPEWADQVWQLAGLAMPVQVNFGISGCARLGREVKAALQRKDGEQTNARRHAVEEIENDLKSTVTGLLLETQLALREPLLPPSLEPRVRHLAELAGVLRDRLETRAKV